MPKSDNGALQLRKLSEASSNSSLTLGCCSARKHFRKRNEAMARQGTCLTSADWSADLQKQIVAIFLSLRRTNVEDKRITCTSCFRITNSSSPSTLKQNDIWKRL
uniref:Uncharacterized protein n=1 Tax=Heterorhabditis bacteriophora TaxID=37862 RepID=A0A1I7X778_HETBA